MNELPQAFKELFKEEDCYIIKRDVAKKCGIKAALVYAYIEKENKEGNLVYSLKDIFELSYKQLTRIKKVLLENNLIIISKITPTEKRQLLKENNYGKGNGEHYCTWCGYKSFVLHEHHYPIPKHKGGTDTVSICPNCHYQYHIFDEKYYINYKLEV